MKVYFFIILLFLLYTKTLAQSANDYFVKTIGTEWKYNYYELDSSQNPILPFVPTYIHERLLTQSPILSKDVYLFSSKQITGEIETSRPDTIMIETFPKPFSEYIDLLNFSGDSLIKSLGFTSPRFSGWYRIMNFQGTLNKSDTLLRFDTTITIDTISFPIQFLFTTTKKSSRTIYVPAGTFDCIPFDVRFRLNYLLAVPIFGTMPIPIIDITDTMYIAKQKWIVKKIRYSSNVPATAAVSALLPPGFPQFTILGNVKELLAMKATSVTNNEIFPARFLLEQNFPNPFNPSTVISYQLPADSFVSLKVYDINGREIAALVNEEQPAGKYSVQFSASNLAGGVYFYRLTAGNFSQTKKFIVLK